MACTARIMMNTILSEYRHEFDSVGSLVDVGGGIGSGLAEIVKSYPHIKGINFDLPHVAATASIYDGITHVGGDMFHSIPNANNTIFMKKRGKDKDKEWSLRSAIVVVVASDSDGDMLSISSSATD
ncbi:hypothetical protein SO802_015661 [Lithocarpus litseifolius]|uniref:O-methyltransferase C-terminal domain-containing protein n=1 Tax=Lithocarpus litseifolius TaxID=425828 RepID=A0AAW2CXL7_9ROSI